MLQIPIVAQLVEDGLWQDLDAPPIARVTGVVRYFAGNGVIGAGFVFQRKGCGIYFSEIGN